MTNPPLDRREFLRIAGAGAGALLTGCAPSARVRPASPSPDVLVVGAGAFGGWTALHLQRLGARVHVVDMFGPGNSRSTSGDETRGIRTSYGDRTHGELWMQWAQQAITRWREFDAQYSEPLKTQLFFTTGDLIMRPDWEPFLTQTRTWWQKNSIPHETLTVEEVQKRWPQIAVPDIKAVLYEPAAGVVRSRRATQRVAEVFLQEGGRVTIGRVIPPEPGEFDGGTLRMTNGDSLRAGTIVFAVGPWLGKTFAVMRNRIRTPIGTVVYYGTAPGDMRFTYPHMPSWNFPGTTGWAALPVDNRGFRVRGGGGGTSSAANRSGSGSGSGTGGGSASGAGGNPGAGVGSGSTAGLSDPDLSVRSLDEERLARPRQFVAERFPALADAPVVQTWACHYESTSSRNFVIDRHPNLPNVWIAGGGNAEGFKMGPVIGEYIARRVLGAENPALDEQFRIPATEFLR